MFEQDTRFGKEWHVDMKKLIRNIENLEKEEDAVRRLEVNENDLLKSILVESKRTNLLLQILVRHEKFQEQLRGMAKA